MKKNITIIISILLLLSACEKRNQLTNNDNNKLRRTNYFNLEPHHPQCDSLENYCIALDSVVEDSRCPQNVQCIWQGRAIAKFILTENNQQHFFILELTKDTTINNYKITFETLTPKPIYDSIVLDINYVANVKVEH